MYTCEVAPGTSCSTAAYGSKLRSWVIRMPNGLYLMPDGTVMVDYGRKKIPISLAQYRANGYRPCSTDLLTTTRLVPPPLVRLVLKID